MSASRIVIVKLAERCNLACPYCYMYAGPDQSWRTRPKRLSAENAALLVERAAELLEGDPALQLSLTFHGGEPLLYGLARFDRLLRELRARLPADRVRLGLQTNGVLLTPAWCEMFAAHAVTWGISADGPAAVHDRFRFGHDGRGSHARVETAIRLSLSRPEWRRLFGGALAVVDPRADGGAIVRYFHALGLRNLDLLLPDATHAAPPAHIPGFSQAMLKRFLREALAAWIEIDDSRFRLRLFEIFLRGFFGVPSSVDAFGGGVDGLTVVESDGSYQLLDVMHICGEGFTSIGGGLADRSLEDQFALQAEQSKPPCATCLRCPAFDICGGGYLPHRFDGKGFDNPSVHCEAILDSISAVGEFLSREVPASAWRPASSAA